MRINCSFVEEHGAYKVVSGPPLSKMQDSDWKRHLCQNKRSCCSKQDDGKSVFSLVRIGLITVFDAILTTRQTGLK